MIRQASQIPIVAVVVIKRSVLCRRSGNGNGCCRIHSLWSKYRSSLHGSGTARWNVLLKETSIYTFAVDLKMLFLFSSLFLFPLTLSEPKNSCKHTFAHVEASIVKSNFELETTSQIVYSVFWEIWFMGGTDFNKRLKKKTESFSTRLPTDQLGKSCFPFSKFYMVYP